MRNPRLISSIIIAAASAVLLAGCSFSFTAGDAEPVKEKSSAVPKGDDSTFLAEEDDVVIDSSGKLTVAPYLVAIQSADALTTELGYVPEIECFDALEAVVGATITCDATLDDGSVHEMVAAVTSVNGADVNFDVVIATVAKA